MEYSINANQVLQVDGVEFVFILLILSSFFHQNSKEKLKSLTITVDLSVALFSSISFCSTYFVALLFGAYTFRIACSLANL